MNKTVRSILIVLALLVVGGGVFYGGFAAASSLVADRTAQTVRRAWTDDQPGFGPGMGGGQDRYGTGPGMMRGYASGSSSVEPLTLDEAKTAAESYLSSLGNADLVISEIMIFDNNAYVVVREASTGMGAFELLVDPVSRTAYPEHGPNMMWNLKYGALNHEQMMGGMMGRRNGSSTYSADITAEMTVTPGQAVSIAQEYLDSWLPGAIAADDPVQFYGYYTLDYEVDGAPAGMLSVHGFSGEIFVHKWHGTFLEEQYYQP